MSRDIQQEGKLLITALPDALCKNRPRPECLMAALIRHDRLAAVQTFSPDACSRVGAVYLGKIKRIVKSLNACFVEIAGREQCFLRMGMNHAVKNVANVAPFLTNRAYDGRLLEGDELLVQLEREAIKAKQAEVTARITMQGEYFVLAMGTTGVSRVGISRKLDDGQRKRLLRFLADWQITGRDGKLAQEEDIPAFGMVARTRAGLFLEQGGEDCEKALYEEYVRLRDCFTALFRQGRHRTCYSCLHRAGSALEMALKPFVPGEYGEIVTDLESVHEELLRLQAQNPLSSALGRIRLYRDPDFSLGKLYSLDARLAEATGRVVWLKSGANLVIEQTESLTAIDVNTGKCVRLPADQSPQDVMRRVNLEAAREVARQLRLRSLSGIIIVDFINLATLAQENELLQELRELAREDPVAVQVVDMTPLGLVEITRKKVCPSLAEQLGRRGALCAGREYAEL